MAEFMTERPVEWGDCDPAGIVWYPNYYRWMDGAFQELAASCGFSQQSLRESQGLIGTPLVDTGCQFFSTAVHGDRLSIAVRIERIGGASLRLGYRFAIGERKTADGFEVRVFSRPKPGGALGEIEAAEIPGEARARLKALAEA